MQCDTLLTRSYLNIHVHRTERNKIPLRFKEKQPRELNAKIVVYDYRSMLKIKTTNFYILVALVWVASRKVLKQV